MRESPSESGLRQHVAPCSRLNTTCSVQCRACACLASGPFAEEIEDQLIELLWPFHLRQMATTLHYPHL